MNFSAKNVRFFSDFTAQTTDQIVASEFLLRAKRCIIVPYRGCEILSSWMYGKPCFSRFQINFPPALTITIVAFFAMASSRDKVSCFRWLKNDSQRLSSTHDGSYTLAKPQKSRENRSRGQANFSWNLLRVLPPMPEITIFSSPESPEKSLKFAIFAFQSACSGYFARTPRGPWRISFLWKFLYCLAFAPYFALWKCLW